MKEVMHKDQGRSRFWHKFSKGTIAHLKSIRQKKKLIKESNFSNWEISILEKGKWFRNLLSHEKIYLTCASRYSTNEGRPY